jgi:pimeloyl-ACP methyl ester carboxylesterase
LTKNNQNNILRKKEANMEQINFYAEDGTKLNGFLHKSKETTQDVILSIHGMSSNCFKERDNVIANTANNLNIDYFCFNNRGSELVKYITKNINGKKTKVIAGTSYEEVLDSYYDIVGAILELRKLGYKNIYLQGHSLGCTKIIYTYNKLKEQNNTEILEIIKSIILLSLVDITSVLKAFLGKNFSYYINLANKMEQEGKLQNLMPQEAFIHPVSCKTFLRYARDNKDIDIKQYNILSKIDKPLFMRWGTDNEMIIDKPDELVKKVKQIIENKQSDVNYIEGANHSYNEKEEILATQILEFIQKQRR